MADEEDLIDEEESEGEEGDQPKKGKKKLIIIIILLLGVIGAVGGLFASGILSNISKKEVSDDLVQKTIYYDMDEFLVNLNNPGNQVSFLKTIITLELPNQASLNEVQSQMPRIRDTFQIYLRELRNSDLQGSAGLQRLRTELLLRINNILEDGTVNNILFKEILVQ
jgi:flagellar FliL protein